MTKRTNNRIDLFTIVPVLLISLIFIGLFASVSQAQNPSIPAPVPPTNPPPTNLPLTVPPLTVPPAAAPPSVTVQSPPSPVGKIAQIIIKGNAKISADAILANVRAEKIGDSYDQTAAEKDRDAIKEMGYFNGEVGLSAVNDPAGGVDVTYTVVENPVVKSIVFTANTPTGEPTIPQATLKKAMKTQEGQVLNTNTLVQDLDSLFNPQTGYVRTQGYFFTVSADINIDPVSGRLTIPLIETHIDSIQIKGNKKTKSKVILREMRSAPGDVLDEKKLQKDLTRVYNTGLFDQIQPADYIPTELGKVIVSISVVEKRSGNVSVAVSYSSRTKLGGRAELAENNFRGLGERVSVTWEVNGISSQSNIDVGFFEPYLDKYHTSLDVDLYDRAIYRFSSSTFGGVSVGSDSTYTETHEGATVGVNRPISDTTTVGLSLRSEYVHINDVEVPTSDTFVRQNGSVSTIGLRGVNNTRDNDISPVSGGLRSVSVEIGTSDTKPADKLIYDPLVPGRHSVNKFGLDLRQYISLQGPRRPGDFRSPKKVFAVRMLLGLANRDIPFFEQYFLGGADSLRGYDTDRFFGNNLLLLQSELRIPLGKSNDLQGVILAEAGDAWGTIYQDPTNSLDQHQNLSLSSDFGLGVRIVTPLGPLRLDYAIGKNGGRTQFSIGQSF